MILFNRNIIVENFNTPSPKPVLDEMDALYEDIINNLNQATKVPSDVLNSFKIKSQLNPEIWFEAGMGVEGNLNPKVRVKLVKIGVDFFKSLELPPNVKLKDIILTGSLANYNWSQYSDIDLHLVLDFSDISDNEKFVQDFFQAQKVNWNETHDIKIFNYPVEIYVQDINAKLAATAVYSVLFDKWILKPKKEHFELDKDNLKAKAEKILNLLKIVKHDYDNQDYKKVVDRVTLIKDKIKKMRTAGLEKGGEFSMENILFKVLRRTPFMDYLDEFKNKAYDNLMSVAETLNEAIFNQGGALLIYGQPQEDGTRRLYATLSKQYAQHDRNKVGGDKGIANRNMTIGDQVYRLSLENGKLKAKGVMWGSDDNKRKALGLSGNNVGLHHNKTPLHQETLHFNNIQTMLNRLNASIVALPDVKWMG
jgi:hypothetical protein